MILPIRIIRIIAALIIIVACLYGCTRLGLNYASLEIDNKPRAWPEINPETFVTNRENIITDLEHHVFGPFPVGLQSRIIRRRLVDTGYANGTGTLEEVTIGFGPPENERRFNLVIAVPNDARGPVPVIVNQTFCSNRVTFAESELSPAMSRVDFCGDDPAKGGNMWLITMIFGRHIATPPIERILKRGYAFAAFYASDIVNDDQALARPQLAAFPAGIRGRPTGSIAAWTAGYAATLDVLEADPRIDPARTAILGHSRHGKSALVAGAFDPRIEAVIAHQAGTGGAALSRFKPGESVKAITKSYPHWFDPAYASFDANGPFTTPTDMHMLIALTAPRKLLLGNGRRDVWSDPNGTYRAALAADPVWHAFGLTGLTQDSMRDQTCCADLVFYMRPGGHGITERDWTHFLAFLDTAIPVT